MQLRKRKLRGEIPDHERARVLNQVLDARIILVTPQAVSPRRPHIRAAHTDPPHVDCRHPHRGRATGNLAPGLGPQLIGSGPCLSLGPSGRLSDAQPINLRALGVAQREPRWSCTPAT